MQAQSPPPPTPSMPSPPTPSDSMPSPPTPSDSMPTPSDSMPSPPTPSDSMPSPPTPSDSMPSHSMPSPPTPSSDSMPSPPTPSIPIDYTKIYFTLHPDCYPLPRPLSLPSTTYTKIDFQRTDALHTFTQHIKEENYLRIRVEIGGLCTL